MARRPSEWMLALASTAAVLLLLGGLEIGLRLFGSSQPDPGGDLHRLHRYSETLGWEPRPGARYCADGACVAVNERGYRGPLLGPKSSKPRVVLLGDSITFGVGVGDDQTFAHWLAADGRLEVVNLAVEGYGPDQSLLRLERDGVAYVPDVVVMNFCLDNDFADTALPTFLYGPQPKPYFELRGDTLVKHDEQLRLSAVPRASLWLQERSVLFRRILAWASSRRQASAAHFMARRHEALADRGGRVRTTFAILRRMREVSTRAGAEFLIVVHPNEHAYRQGSAWLDAFGESPLLRGIPVLSLRDVYRARGLGFGQVATDFIGHLTPLGHRVAAEAIGAEVRRLLEERGSRPSERRPPPPATPEPRRATMEAS